MKAQWQANKKKIDSLASKVSKGKKKLAALPEGSIAHANLASELAKAAEDLAALRKVNKLLKADIDGFGGKIPPAKPKPKPAPKETDEIKGLGKNLETNQKEIDRLTARQQELYGKLGELEDLKKAAPSPGNIAKWQEAVDEIGDLQGKIIDLKIANKKIAKEIEKLKEMAKAPPKPKTPPKPEISEADAERFRKIEKMKADANIPPHRRKLVDEHVAPEAIADFDLEYLPGRTARLFKAHTRKLGKLKVQWGRMSKGARTEVRKAFAIAEEIVPNQFYLNLTQKLPGLKISEKAGAFYRSHLEEVHAGWGPRYGNSQVARYMTDDLENFATTLTHEFIHHLDYKGLGRAKIVGKELAALKRAADKEWKARTKDRRKRSYPTNSRHNAHQFDGDWVWSDYESFHSTSGRARSAGNTLPSISKTIRSCAGRPRPACWNRSRWPTSPASWSRWRSAVPPC